MAVNASELVYSPWTTVFSPFVDLLGTGFYLIPVSFIAVALYIKTKDLMVSSVWLIASGLLLSGGGIFAGYWEMSSLYVLVCALGVTGTVMSIFFMRK